jgi:hypothetical protein
VNRDPFADSSGPPESSAPAEGAEYLSPSGRHRLTAEEWAAIHADDEKTPEPIRWAAKHIGLKTVATVVGVLLVNAFVLGGIWWGIKAHAQTVDDTVATANATAESAKSDVVALENKVARVAQSVEDQVAQSKATNARLDQVTQLLVQLASRRSSVPDPAPAPPKRAPKEPQP